MTPLSPIPPPAARRSCATTWLPFRILGIWLLAAATVQAVELAPDAPQRYEVRSGDTLWGIASKFLRDPWRWRELWQSNERSGDPGLIYPGEVLQLTTVAGEPRLRREQGIPEGPDERVIGYQNGMRVVKLTPRVRTSALESAIPTIPIASLAPFLTQPYVTDSDHINRAPYIVGFPDEKIVAGTGDAVYVRRIDSHALDRFQVLRPGGALRDPETNELLGFESTFVANVLLERTGDPARMRVLRAEREISIGDRVIPTTLAEPLSNFYPQPAPHGLRGQILRVMNGVSQVGALDIVVINLGQRERLERGHIFEVFQGGDKGIDQVRIGGDQWDWKEETPLSGSFWLGNDWTTRRWRHDEPDASSPVPPTVDIRRQRGTFIKPFERSGALMVFRTFERVSFAIVLEANRSMRIGDRIAPPPV